jgi:hypothetical protein
VDGTLLDAVRCFAAALREIRGRLFADLAPIGDVSGLMRAVRATRELPREAVTSSGIEYSVHGKGCRMTAADGREVDVDMISDPVLGREVEAFDAWRIRRFLDEAGRGGHREDDIVAACTQLAADGELRVVLSGRWFALP